MTSLREYLVEQIEKYEKMTIACHENGLVDMRKRYQAVVIELKDALAKLDEAIAEVEAFKLTGEPTYDPYDYGIRDASDKALEILRGKKE